jgi:ubiquinone/menaquinone biosynthesis C-methylase UbiE
MKSIDEKVLSGYNSGIEKNRLRSNMGLVEYARTKELLLEYLPKPPAIIYDIGGGYGEYAWLLTSLGYEVHLFDISEKNIEMSHDLAIEYPGYLLHSAEVADARNINRPDNSADAILFMGPMYHIVEYDERILALKECGRLLKENGVLFTAALTRYSCTLYALSTYGVKNRLLEYDEYCNMLYHELETGQHIKPDMFTGMGRSFFHSPNDLRQELNESGFNLNDVRGVIGGSWLVPDLDAAWKNNKAKENIMNIVRITEKDESIMSLSTHLLAMSYK